MCEPACVLREGGVGGEPTKSINMRYAQFDVGEIFNSARQLLMRYSQFYFNDPSSSVMSLWPYFTSMVYLTTGVGKTAPNVGGDMFSYVSPCYVFYRGGVRVNIASSAQNQFSSTLNPNALSTQTSPISNSAGGPQNSGQSIIANWQASTSIQPLATSFSDIGVGNYAFQCPYYSRTPVSINFPLRANTIPTDESQSQSVVYIRNVNANFTNEIWSRSIAEDFQFTYFIGCPPLLVSIV